jgi:hypothetical protein
MKVLLAVIALVLAGCASGNYGAAQQAFARQDWATAERHLEAEVAARPSGQAWWNLAVVYDKQGKTQPALGAARMSARYGDSSAQAALAKLGQAVPPADLAPQESAIPLGDWGYNRRRSRDCLVIPVGKMVSLDCD